MLLYVFLAVYSTLCSPQPSDTVFLPNVDVTFSWKPSDSENSGSDQETFVSSARAPIVILAGHITRSGGLVSGNDKRTVNYLISLNNLVVHIVISETSISI